MPPALHERVVGEEAEAFAVAGFAEFADKIAAAGRVHDVERLDLGVPQAEAFVMACRQIDVFHAGREGEIRNGVRVEMMGGELRRKLFVFRKRDLVHEHGPFMAMEQRIQAVVEEKAEFRVFEPCENGLLVVLLPKVRVGQKVFGAGGGGHVRGK